MHTFQKITPDIVEINPFEKIGKDWMLVTAGNEEKANTMTASWGALGQRTSVLAGHPGIGGPAGSGSRCPESA